VSRRRLRRRGGTRRGTAQGNFDAAIRDYTAAIRIDGAHFKAYYNRAFAYSKVGLHARAVESYTDALRIDPSSANAHHNRGALSAHRLQLLPLCEREPAHVGTAQVGTAHVGTAHVGAAELGTAEVGTAQVGTAQVGTAQVGTAHRWRRCASANRAGSALEKLDDDAAAIADFTKAIELSSANASAYAPNPAYGESRLQRIPLTANPAYGESRLRRISLIANFAKRRIPLTVNPA
jgi:tetratricopeptide (TPR) repeat protein